MHTRERHDPPLRFVETLGLEPFGAALRQALLAARGDATTPKSRLGLSSLRIFRPRTSVALWLGQKPEGRLVPVVNLFNYRQPPPELGWSVRVTDVRDFRGGRNTYDSHNGTDFAIPPGTFVVAAAPGEVLRVSSEFHRGGRKVVIDHGRGLATTYNHLARPLVTPGQRVRRGERIAVSGYSGLDAVIGFPWVPPHVHFNCWLNGRYVDPFSDDLARTPSLWRSPNAPTPARLEDEADAAFEPTEWSEEGLASLLAACLHAETRQAIERAPTLSLRAGEALFHSAYFPTRFQRGALAESSLYTAAFPREARLDLPFSWRDYDGVLVED